MICSWHLWQVSLYFQVFKLVSIRLSGWLSHTCRSVVAQTDCLLYAWDFDAVEKMAGDSYPALAAAWRNFILYTVGSAFSSTCGDVRALPDQLQTSLTRTIADSSTPVPVLPIQDWSLANICSKKIPQAHSSCRWVLYVLCNPLRNMLAQFIIV